MTVALTNLPSDATVIVNSYTKLILMSPDAQCLGILALFEQLPFIIRVTLDSQFAAIITDGFSSRQVGFIPGITLLD